MKRFFFILLLMTFSLSIFAQTFTAKNPQGQEIKYKVIDKINHYVSISKNRYHDKSYIIPSTVEYNGITYTVTELGTEALNDCSKVRIFQLPNTVTMLGEDAIENCPLLEFTFPDSLKTIHEDFFSQNDMGRCGVDIRNLFGKELKINGVKGFYKLYKWKSPNVLYFKNSLNGSLLTYKDFKRIQDISHKQFSSNILKGSFVLIDLDKSGLMTFYNEEIKMTLTAKDEESLNSKISDLESTCFTPVLKSVERESNANTKISNIKDLPTDSTRESYFKDNFIDTQISFEYTSKAIGFYIKNISKGSIKIIWDDAAFVDYLGNSSALVSDETKFIDVNRSAKSTVIVKNSHASGFMFPASKINGTNISPLFPKHTTKIIDKNIIILLPILVGNVKYEYTLTYQIEFNDLIGKRN